MKLEPLFTVKNNELYKIADNSKVELKSEALNQIHADKLVFTDDSFCKVLIPWSKVELDEEVYNEEFLAALRDFLKLYDEKNHFVIIKPIVDKDLSTPEAVELFINAFNHTARRIKDCVSVAGIELPPQLIEKGFAPATPAADFMEKLAIKHQQYVYFAEKTLCGNTAETELSSIVLL